MMLLGLVASLLSSPTVSAQTTGDIRALCLSGDAEAVALCSGYATGLAQALSLTNKFDNPLGNFCPSEDFRPQDGGALLLQYQDAHPDVGSLDAAATMLAALIAQFPCP